MEVSNSSGDYLLSLQNALGMAMLNNAMNKNGAVLGRLLEGMEEVSAKSLEMSVNPHLGANIDLRV